MEPGIPTQRSKIAGFLLLLVSLVNILYADADYLNAHVCDGKCTPAFGAL